MLELEEALGRILSAVPPPATERIALTEAQGRSGRDSFVASQPPDFDNSAMDGYAVRAADVVGAAPGGPIRLRVAAKLAAGDAFKGEITTGACVRLFTGSPLPRGADAVVMQEDNAN